MVTSEVLTGTHAGQRWSWRIRAGRWLTGMLVVVLGACAQVPELPTADQARLDRVGDAPLYLIGPGDTLSIFVWENPELSAAVPVRPDGRISTPLVEDMRAAGSTPSQLARAMEKALQRYVRNPVVSVIVTDSMGQYTEQIRVVGEATEPKALAYRERMTLLDVLIAVGGLTEFADGNDAVLVRESGGKQQRYGVRLDDLVRDGDISANVLMMPGDILIIPEAWF